MRKCALTTLLKPHLQIASPRWSGTARASPTSAGLMSDEGITGGDVYVMRPPAGAPVNVTQVWRSPHRRLPGMLRTRIRGYEFARATKCSPV